MQTAFMFSMPQGAEELLAAQVWPMKAGRMLRLASALAAGCHRCTCSSTPAHSAALSPAYCRLPTNRPASASCRRTRFCCPALLFPPGAASAGPLLGRPGGVAQLCRLLKCASFAALRAAAQLRQLAGEHEAVAAGCTFCRLGTAAATWLLLLLLLLLLLRLSPCMCCCEFDTDCAAVLWAVMSNQQQQRHAVASRVPGTTC